MNKMYPQDVFNSMGMSSRKETIFNAFWDRNMMKTKNEMIQGTEKHEERVSHLADRVLLLLSFKDTNTQNLRYIQHVLGARTLQEKRNTLHEIFRLIQEGIVYVPKGLPQLIEKGHDLDDPEEIENIVLCILRPFDQLVTEIMAELAKLEAQEAAKWFLMIESCGSNIPPNVVIP